MNLKSLLCLVAMTMKVSHNINYVLDPQYTSVMNDIKIMSRGGAKLSEILPNYILKSIEEKKLSLTYSNASVDGDLPDCPTGYKHAVAILPVVYGKNMIKTSTDESGNVSVQKQRFAIKIDFMNEDRTGYSAIMPATFKGAGGSSAKYRLWVGYLSDDTTIPTALNFTGWASGNDSETIYLIIQHYCVFKDFDWNGSTSGFGDAPEKDRDLSKICPGLKTEDLCEHFECSWNSTTSTCSVP